MIRKINFALLLILTLTFIGFAQTDEINIIPKPSSISMESGTFTLDHKTKIVATDKEGRRSAGILNDLLMARYGFKLEFTNKKQSENFISLQSTVSAIKQSNTMPGSYKIGVTSKQIVVEGTELGQFYAIQSLIQLLPVEFKGKAEIPAMTIVDAPRFQYRGMHLDVSRHFMPVEFVKKYIDLMAQYKFNYFHWHLTDDQGWRIEIKKYPKLTEVGSKRPESHLGPYTTTFRGDGRPVEGYYTQTQIKEIVKYAKDRHITVIPEIELPGHASAAIAAYPELGCKTDYKYEVQKTWGIFKETFCPTEQTFKFLENVLDETIKLFPDSPYIHIGGDEVLMDHWKESEFVQELKKREGLKNEHEVQSYFIRRMEKFVNSKNRKIIGWDEILEGGLAPNATVMSWRGHTGGIAAAKAKHDVIMTPNSHVYLDYGQGDPAYEPLNIGGHLPLSRVYGFDPVPPELNEEEAKYVIGGQANIWTEYLEQPANVEYSGFPRILAVAESVWTRPENKNYDDFFQRLTAHFPRLDKQNVNYRIPEPRGLQNIVTQNEKAVIELMPHAGMRVHFTIDGSTPDETSPMYSKPIEISLNPGEIKTLKTIVINAKGRKSVTYTATIVRGLLQNAAEVNAQTPGVSYEFIVPNKEHESLVHKGSTRSIQLTQFANSHDLKKPFSIQFDGYVRIPTDGIYEFQADATWDTTIVLNGQMIIDDEGTAERKARNAIVPLKAGLHKISLRYNNRGGEPHFRFRFGIKGQGLRQAYGGEFVH